MTHFLAGHEKMCQISYKISLFWVATMVARKMSQTLGTYDVELLLKKTAIYVVKKIWSGISQRNKYTCLVN
jgi:hypothetical protein